MQLGRDAARLHPAAQAPARVEDGETRDQQFGGARLLRGAAAEVGVDRGDECRLVVVDQRQQPAKTLAPDRLSGKRLGGESQPLRGEARGEFGKGGRGNDCHGGPASGAMTNWRRTRQRRARRPAGEASLAASIANWVRTVSPRRWRIGADLPDRAGRLARGGVARQVHFGDYGATERPFVFAERRSATHSPANNAALSAIAAAAR